MIYNTIDIKWMKEHKGWAIQPQPNISPPYFNIVDFPSGLPDNSAHILKSMVAFFWLIAQL